MKHGNWFWGIFFVAAAVLIIASQVTSFARIGFWTIAAAVLLAAVFFQSLVRLNYFGVFISLALGYILFQLPLHLVYISPWLLLLAAVLLAIGFHTIFRTRPKNAAVRRRAAGGSGDYRTVEDIDDNNPYVKVSFGASSKYLHADALRGGQFYCNFGALEVYFDQVHLAPEGAEIFVDCSFGEIKLFFPRSWQVEEKLHSGIGGVTSSFRGKPAAEGAPQITVTGNVSLGSLVIDSV
jgi:membrane protein implicated in regulation of membrane protease activity